VRHRRISRGKCIRSLLIRQSSHPHLIVSAVLVIVGRARTWRVFNVEGVVLIVSFDQVKLK
jgi:hypothetical protein